MNPRVISLNVHPIRIDCAHSFALPNGRQLVNLGDIEAKVLTPFSVRFVSKMTIRTNMRWVLKRTDLDQLPQGSAISVIRFQSVFVSVDAVSLMTPETPTRGMIVFDDGGGSQMS